MTCILEHKHCVWWLHQQYKALLTLQNSTTKDRHYQAVFPKHTLKHSFTFWAVILNKGNTDNKAGCCYPEFQEQIHWCSKKNLRSLKKKKPCPHVQINSTNIHIQEIIFWRTHAHLFKCTQTQQSFFYLQTSPHQSL